MTALVGGTRKLEMTVVGNREGTRMLRKTAVVKCAG
jgi:hypothetical protein